ncbi:MAG: hypothetical protein ACD_8C00033G0003 [uncultured bacterium]|nr:MAG: hypothetical protein ACD_8C00033G0003 [uncultured bacterium]
MKHKNENNHEGFKALILGFVTNILEKVSDNVTHKVQTWTRQMKRRAAGSVVMVLGMTYLLTGLSTYTEATFGKNIPGLGYVIIGAVAILIGYLVSRK